MIQIANDPDRKCVPRIAPHFVPHEGTAFHLLVGATPRKVPEMPLERCPSG